MQTNAPRLLAGINQKSGAHLKSEKKQQRAFCSWQRLQLVCGCALGGALPQSLILEIQMAFMFSP